MNSICLYCGSSFGAGDVYSAAAKELARELVRREIQLVYGGARVGTMGVLADSVLEAGGRVTGVIPEALVDKEVAHDGLTELFVTPSMHERKTKMADLAEGFVALPGGIGTLEELFEIWTWAQLGFHRKPVGVLNVDNFYQPLIELVDHAVGQGFVKPMHREILAVEADVAALLDRLEGYSPPNGDKWS
ncbi:MAG: TIGR00730 family Rossman fold protein [Planctomycetota bacterium]